MTIVGTVVALNRYPVKSMAGERLDEADLRWHGVAGDRQYGFVRTADPSRFPWLSARDLSTLLLYRAAYADPSDPRRSQVEVTVPDGGRHDVGAPALLERLAAETGDELALLQMGRGLYDAMPVSVATTATHAALDAAHGAPVNRARFRTNIVVDSGERETDWRGRTLSFGDGAARLLPTTPIPRCALVTIDPETGIRDVSILRTAVRSFDNQVGIYCAPAAIGTIRVGDAVRIAD